MKGRWELEYIRIVDDRFTQLNSYALSYLFDIIAWTVRFTLDADADSHFI